MFFQNTAVSLRELLTPNAIDELFLIQFNELPIKDKISKIQELIGTNQFDFIAKLSCINKDFRGVCLLQQFDSTWLSAWSTIGVIITGEPKRALLAQPCNNFLDLFLGIYFYHKSTCFSKKNALSSMEHAYLIEAIKYGSIHALQKYSRSLYKDEQIKTVEKVKQIQWIITTIKPLLSFYTSYAYLMLAEAYVQYSLLRPELAPLAKKSAITACIQAEKLYKEEDPVIFNASFGFGLADSNSMSYATPQEAIAGINELFDPSAGAAHRLSSF